MPTDSPVQELARASIPGGDVGVPNDNCSFGFPARGAGAVNLAALMVPGQIYSVSVIAVDGGGRGLGD